jgi:cytochrome c556
MVLEDSSGALLYSFNLNILGGMAKGEVDYDAEAASAAAANLAAVSKLNQMAYWPPGTDSESVDGSRTLAKAWDNVPDLIEKGTALATAASAMEAAAGTDLASLQSAMGPLGGTCSACHKAYRVPRN